MVYDGMYACYQLSGQMHSYHIIGSMLYPFFRKIMQVALMNGVSISLFLNLTKEKFLIFFDEFEKII